MVTPYPDEAGLPAQVVIDRLIRAVVWQPRRTLLVLLFACPVACGGGLRLFRGRWDETAVVMTLFLTGLCHVIGIAMAAVGPPVVGHPLLGALGTSPQLTLPTRSHGWVAFFAHGVLLERVGPLREARYFSRDSYPALGGVEIGGASVTLRIETVQGGGRHGSATLQIMEEQLDVDPAVLATLGTRLRDVTNVRHDARRPAVRHVHRAVVAMGATLLSVAVLGLAGWAWLEFIRS